MTHAHTTSLQTLINGFPLTPGTSPLPTAGCLPQLASDDIRSMGDTSSERVPIRIHSTMSSGSQGPPLNGGDTEAHSKGCSKEGHLLPKSIPKLDFSGSQERWISKAGDQPETTEPAHPPNLFQDGESGNDQRPAERGRLDGLLKDAYCQ